MKAGNNPIQKVIGRGSQTNTDGRFESLTHVVDYSDYGWLDEEQETSLLRTQFFKDSSKSIVTENNSPDVGCRFTLNSYRGCEHGCAYCFARPTHEYLGLSAGLDFESKIFVKEQAPVLLRKKLLASSWKGEPIMMSGITDCYQPAERKYQLTRKCLEVFLDFRNPVVIITKNQLIRRDVDLLTQLAQFNAVRVLFSVTTLDAQLARKLEPRTSTPQAKLEAIADLSKQGIPVGVNIGPVIPGLTDHEIPAILKAVSEAGAKSAGYILVRLPYSVKELFVEWLTQHYPERKDKIVHFIMAARGGKLNDPRFGSRMEGDGKQVENIDQLFAVFSRKYGLNQSNAALSSSHFRKSTAQLNLFGEEA